MNYNYCHLKNSNINSTWRGGRAKRIQNIKLHALMAAGIAWCREMRSRFYVIIIFLLTCRILMCLQLIFLATYRFLRVVNVVDFPPRIACSLMAILVYPGTLELLLLLVLAIDRTVGLFAMSYYRALNWQQAAKASKYLFSRGYFFYSARLIQFLICDLDSFYLWFC